VGSNLLQEETDQKKKGTKKDFERRVKDTGVCASQKKKRGFVEHAAFKRKAKEKLAKCAWCS